MKKKSVKIKFATRKVQEFISMTLQPLSLNLEAQARPNQVNNLS